MILVIFLYMLQRMQITKSFQKEMLPLPLLQKLTVIGPLIGTILYYAEGNSCNQKVFWNGCNGAMGFSFRLKRKRKKNDKTKSPKFLGIRDFVYIIINAHYLNPRIVIPQLKTEFNIIGLTQFFFFFFFHKYFRELSYLQFIVLYI